MLRHVTPSARAAAYLRRRAAWAALAWAVASLSLAGNPGRAAQRCAAGPQDEGAVIRALESWFGALQSGDSKAAGSLMTSAFFAYDAGKRFTGPALLLALEQAHAAGQHFEWNLSAFDVHMSCDQAWVAYENTGGVRTSQGLTPLHWLESAVLQRHDGRWRLVFLHSTAADP